MVRGGEGGESGEAHLAREKIVDTKLVKVERPPRLLARLRDCVPLPGTYVPKTGTPSPFPNGMEL